MDFPELGRITTSTHIRTTPDRNIPGPSTPEARTPDFLHEVLNVPTKSKDDPILKVFENAEKKFEEFVQNATRAMNEPQAEPQQSSTTREFFINMANELDKANVPENTLREIKRDVMSIVFDAIDKHQN